MNDWSSISSNPYTLRAGTETLPHYCTAWWSAWNSGPLNHQPFYPSDSCSGGCEFFLNVAITGCRLCWALNPDHAACSHKRYGLFFTVNQLNNWFYAAQSLFRSWQLVTCSRWRLRTDNHQPLAVILKVPCCCTVYSVHYDTLTLW